MQNVVLKRLSLTKYFAEPRRDSFVTPTSASTIAQEENLLICTESSAVSPEEICTHNEKGDIHPFSVEKGFGSEKSGCSSTNSQSIPSEIGE